MQDYEIARAQMAQLMDDNAITIAAVFIPYSVSRSAGSEHASLNWRVTLLHKGVPVLLSDYTAGSGHCPATKSKQFGRGGRQVSHNAMFSECETGQVSIAIMSPPYFRASARLILPDSVDVFSSFLLDASGTDETFSDWCANYAYSDDSLKARAAYDTCHDTRAKLLKAFGRDLVENASELGSQL